MIRVQSKRILAGLLSLIMVFGLWSFNGGSYMAGAEGLAPVANTGSAPGGESAVPNEDHGAVTNPTPVVDIVVNVPADYPGTFLDFKEELTDKLVEQGMDPDTFRIVSAAIKIDTTDTAGWYVYDHYNSQNDYNNLKVDSLRQPFRQADNSHANGTNPTTIEKEFASTVPAACKYFVRHISSSVDEAGKAKMIFAGYGSQALADFMIYPAASDSRRTFSFDIDAKRVDTHTLTGTGFFVNAGIEGTGTSATVSGYLLFYQFTSATAGNIYLIPMTKVNAMNFQTSNVTSLYSQAIAKDTFNLGASKKARIDVDLQATSLTVQQRNYASDGITFEETKTLFGGKAVTMNRTGFNGFGPMAAYGSHGCSSLSSFEFSDLEMNYEANAFDALKNVQYSEDAEYKYFINLTGTNADPGVPKDDEAYLEGIKRLNENGIFYVSNTDDGKILTQPTEDSSGIGPDNGLYATNADYITQIAEYIAENFNEQVHFKPVEILEQNEKPIADFIIVQDDEDGQCKQVLTAHLQHLKTAEDKITVHIQDKSMTNSAGDKITGWQLKVYDPDNGVVASSNGFVDDPSKLPSYSITKNSKQGKYLFELVVKDVKGTESTVFQTYLTAYQDTAAPSISASSGGYGSPANVVLVDQGYGIDADGVTLIENAGSGVLKYQVNDGEIITLEKEVHAYNLSVQLTEEPLKITTWDECGNESTKTFNTVKVEFQDGDHDPYYTLEGDKLGALPEGPTPDDENKHFQGWADEDDNLVSSDTVVNDDIVLHPVYTTETVTLTFEANGGTYGNTTTKVVEVPKGSKIIDNLLSGDELPTRTGYNFTHWTISGAEVHGQTADAANTTLKANWEKGQFTLKFDANGGNLGKLKEKSVEYEADLSYETTTNPAGNPYAGMDLPTREGYTFKGWAKDTAGTAITSSDKMPAHTYTVYAKWEKDNSRFIVSFDSNGGSQVPNKSYPTSEDHYGTLNTPSRSGYTFDGWFDESGTKRESDGEVYKQADHTLTARWTANDDTQYKVEYYLRDDSGYHRDDSLTVTHYGTTDTACSVSEGDVKNIAGYWYNADNALNVLSGTITGDGKATLKLYYDRYFAVTGSKDGEGTVTATGTLKEGQDGLVSWKAASGYQVGQVIVDGVVRDDLLQKNSISFTDVHENHQVYVKFVKQGGSGGNLPDMGNTGYYQVKTRIDGLENSCTITPTQTVKKGVDHTVEWEVCDGYYIVSVTVDGKEYAVNATEVDFTSIAANHEVVVKTEKMPSMGGDTTTGYYTVTVNRYGGNSKDTIVSGNQVVAPGSSAKVTWSAANGYHVSRVVVDGKPLDASLIAAGLQQFENIQGNHVVDVYFEKDGSGDGTGSWTEDMVTVSTQLVGGPGSITAGATLPKDSDYKVTWEPVFETTDNPDDPDYAVYEVEKVEVNGTQWTGSGNEIDFSHLEKDQDVKVYVKPVVYQVTTLAYGNGTVSSSKTLYKNQSYLNILGTPNAGNEVKKLVIDGAEQPISDINTRMRARFMALAANETEVDAALTTGTDVNINAISQDHVIEVYFAASGASLPDEGDLIRVTAEIIGGTGSVSGSGIFAKGSDDTVSWIVDSKYEVQDVKVNGSSVSFSGNQIDLSNLQTDTKVEIIVAPAELSKNDETPDGGTNQPNRPSYNISTEIIGGPGDITSGARVEKGESFEVEWEISEPGYEIRDVIVDGISRPDLISPDGTGDIRFDKVVQDHSVQVLIGEKAKVNIDVDKDGIPDVNIDTDGDGDGKPDINVDLDGDGIPDINIDTDNTGTWKPSGEGGNGDEIWKPDTNLDTDADGKVDVEHGFRPGYDFDQDGVDDNWNPDKDVYPDGLGKPGYDTTDPNLNVDTDGDGKPDVNVDTDGDGKPDVNVDTDGDGKPDVNVDTDGDGKPDVNVDTDGDGKPDVNVDTDGDGKPDVNVDTDGDGKPDLNIDTDGDGVPDLNIDTNDDGKADKNIDANGDGIPETGESANTALLIGTMGMSAFLMMAAALLRTKKRKQAVRSLKR